MKKVKEIADFCYRMQLGFGRDVWQCYGMTCEGERFLSTPIAYDKETKTLETQNTIYKIVNFGGNVEEIETQLETDIKNQAYETH